MDSMIIGFVAVVVGGVFCLSGIVAMRIVITLWGAFVGFNLGAGIIAAFGTQGFLTTWLSWVLGIVLALIFAFFAYLYYAVAVVLAMASAGFVIGSAVMVAVGVSWNWFIILVGVLIGILLAVLAIKLNLPAALLVVISALAGSTAVVGGLMLIVGTLQTEDFTRASITRTLADSWWWWLIYVVLALVGIVAQSRMLSPGADARQQW